MPLLSPSCFYPHPTLLWSTISLLIHPIGWQSRAEEEEWKPQKFTVNLSHSQRGARNEHLAADTRRNKTIPLRWFSAGYFIFLVHCQGTIKQTSQGLSNIIVLLRWRRVVLLDGRPTLHRTYPQFTSQCLFSHSDTLLGLIVRLGVFQQRPFIAI